VKSVIVGANKKINVMKNLFKKIFGKKIIEPKHYKIPLVANNGMETGLICEFIKDDETYKKILAAYGEIPPIIYVNSLDK